MNDRASEVLAGGFLPEKALEVYLKRISDLGNPVRIKFVPFLAFVIARQRSKTEKPINPPGKNWAQGFVRRHPALKSRRVRAIDWKRHENNIYDKIIHWFDVIGKVLRDPAVLSENVYNMDETGVMLCMLGSVKVIISKDDPRDYRGAGVKRTMVTAIEYISVDDNPDRVLRNTPKPPTPSTGTEIDAIRAAAYPQDEAIQTPVTPVTPVSAEGLMSLYNQIKQDTQTLDATSTQRLQKRVQKLANAAQVSFAECALLNNRNQFLTEANNEAKVRRLTKPVVLGKGKAKVMSFEDLEVARAARVAKDAVKSKGKRGRKRKNTEPETSEAELELEVEVEVVSSTKKV
ncbi:hypothetical protein V8E51_010353 [Hyaloscypha variabilis]